jgi:hypothetical protein
MVIVKPIAKPARRSVLYIYKRIQSILFNFNQLAEDGTMSSTKNKLQTLLAVISVLILTVTNLLPAQAAITTTPGNGSGKGLWQHVTGTPPPARQGAKPAVSPRRFGAYKLNHGGMVSLLATAPREHGRKVGKNALVLSLPSPSGDFEDFAIEDSPIMEDGLAAKHPDIKTFRGIGIDDPTATIRLDITPLGFHASVRSTQGAWYIDPYYQLEDSLYASYYGRDLLENPHGVFAERDGAAPELSIDHGYYHAADTVAVSGSGFAANTGITITISDPEEHFAARTLNFSSDELGSFEAEFVADPDGNLDTHIVEASDGSDSGWTSYQVVGDDDPTTDPPTGDVLRIYRLALITDPGYANFFGGSANVTAEKVTLMNRVDQIYEDDLSIRMMLVNNNDLLNLDTWAQAIGPNGPCGAAACFTQSQVTGCSSTTRARYVIGQIIGASNYDIGHLALGEPGGGVANLGVVGRSNKAGGCTGIPTPTGDYYAVDYVAHEMGHQFSGNHPFNGNQLNCSGGNRNAATSVEPGSGSSVMAYAGICLTDDLQAHSDPYFSQRSQQEISTYTSSNQSAINEVQTASLRHFGGGNEVQVVTFGPGFAPAATIQPLSLAINVAPNATSVGGAQENGNTVTIATGNAHTLQVGDVVTISGVGVAGYNGTWTVTAVPTTRSFQYGNPVAGLATSGGGTVTLNAPGATEAGTTVTISTAAAHGRSVGDVVTIAGVGVAGYNGTFTITGVPDERTFQYTAAASGLANSGGGTATYFSPFQVRINGNDSALIGGSGLPYTIANIQPAINAIAGFAGTVTVSGVSSNGFTITYGGASAGVDVPNIELVNLNCGGCFASVEETNHGGANDTFTLNYNGTDSAPITNGVNYTTAGIQAALLPILPAGATATIAAFGGSGTLNNTGFQVTFGGALAATNVPVMLSLTNLSDGASGFVGETDKGGPVDNKGGTITPTGDSIPVVSAPAQYTIPLRTPFSLTGSATDADGGTLLYSWEQNDRGGSAGTSLLNNTKTNGPLFAMFPKSGQISLNDALQYNSPGENHLTTDPTRVFPDLQQILDNNTNADTGACPTAGPIAQPVPQNITECFAEFLPTSAYAGFTGVNASPLSLHFRLTARDLFGGTSSADTTLLLATNAGPFLITSPNTAVSYQGGSTQTVAWDPANTNIAPVSAANVKISLSTDGGYTYPYVLAESTANDGSEPVTLPNIATTSARVKIEAVGNIFFDISNADFTIQAVPVVSNSLGEGGSQSVQYSDSLSPDVTITAGDDDSLGTALSASATGLPAGLSLAIVSTTNSSTLPGSRTWKVDGATTAAPGSYPVSVTVTDESGGNGITTFTLIITQEDAEATYSGDMLAFTASGGASANVLLRATALDSSVVPAFGDSQAGDIRNATVTFKEGTTTLCGPLPAALINGDTTIGTASCITSLGLGTHQIDIYIDNYYTGETSGIVEVAQPDGSFITGGGFLTIGKSSGTYFADSGSKMDFGFNVQYKNQKNLQGHANIIFRNGSHTYQIKSTAIDSLGIALKTPNGKSCGGPPSSTCFGIADFRSKANLTDVTNPLAPVSLGGNLSLQITMTDQGEPGSNDTIGVTLWDGNKLVFSSEWRGSKTVEQLLGGGNLVVH